MSVTELRATGRSQRKAKGDGHLRRAEILAAAERIFVECGYEGATIRRIAEDVGVSSTALYMHFRDKSEILVEICSEAFSQLIASNARLALADMDPVERVRAMLEAYIAFGFENPNAYQLLFCPSTAEIPPDKQDILNGLGARCYALFSDAVAQIQEAGRLRAEDHDAAAQVLWSGPHGLVSLMILRSGFEWADRKRLISLMLDGLFRGLVI